MIIGTRCIVRHSYLALYSMAFARPFKLLASILGGAVLGGVAWLIANSSVKFNDVGWLTGRADWWAQWYAWSAAVAALAAGRELIFLARRKKRVQAMQQAAEWIGLKYMGDAER